MKEGTSSNEPGFAQEGRCKYDLGLLQQGAHPL